MSHADIIRMAREAFIARGFWPNEVMWACWRDAWLASAAAENEACAKVAGKFSVPMCESSADAIATAIRARGNQ
jgi:hypothetical protein